MDNKIYIYNSRQAYFYIQQGLIPTKVREHDKTGNICYIFDKEKSRSLYTRWLSRDAELKVI